MSKLKLVNIRKTYKAGEIVVDALKDVSLEFRKSEFVSILGPSGCGKTTLLNVVGGLDRYDSGDLIINNLSTEYFKDRDWDSYRNKSIGFVFQNYNLISHQSVLHNVEISLTLSGVRPKERKRRATEALASVNIEDQIKKKPNQLSGGQMQRVAIARALVNNPDIILADEPTGALDSHTSDQLMKILQEISKTRLVIMVTHNAEMANEYSSRVIRLLDGEVQSDSNPITDKESSEKSPEIIERKNKKLKKTSMSLLTATSLSFKNLLTKKGRTIITSLAGSIGIIGVALVLALSSGMSDYIGSMQAEALSGFPISITTGVQDVDFNDRGPMRDDDDATGFEKFTDGNVIYRYDSSANTTKHTNIFTTDYLEYISKMEDELTSEINTISYTKGVNINLLAKGESAVVKYDTTVNRSERMALMGINSYWQEMPDNQEFILTLYDLIGDGSRLATEKNEVVIVVDEYNRIDEEFFRKLGILEYANEYKITDFIGKTMLKVITNNDYYIENDSGNFIPANTTEYNNLYESNNGLDLVITGVLRLKEGAASSYLSPGIVYTVALTDYIADDAKKSDIALAQENADYDVVLNIPFANDEAKKQKLIDLGAITTPTGVNIYPEDFDSKDSIKMYLDEYNVDKDTIDQIIYIDLAEMITNIMGTLISTITYVLVGFAAISLVVSTVMIGIITYVSVIERTKEIGILRSVGARKKDISRVFNTETLIIGLASGVIGVSLSYLFTILINSIIERLVDIKDISNLSFTYAIILIVGSMTLTFIAGLIPSRMAANKDPVIALKTE